MPPNPEPQVFKFNKNREFLAANSAVAVKGTATNDTEVALALARNTRFPDRQITYGKVELSAETDQPVTFLGGKGKVDFEAGGGVFGGLGVYPNPGPVLAALDLDDNIGPGVQLPKEPERNYLILQSGYRLAAGAQGSIALAAGFTPTFGVQAAHSGAYAVIRSIAKTTGARDAVQDIVDSWILPRKVDSATRLDPGTWLVAEVDGSIVLSLGAQYGYDFNWVRAARLGGLSGDIGLKIQAGVSATLGFSAAAKYAVVLSRESLDASAQRLRLRLFRLSQNGWNFAFDASASVQGKTKKFLPGQYDRFIGAVLGLDPGQLMEDLRRWVDPRTPLPELIAGESIDLVNEVLTEVTGFDAEAEFERARSELTGLFDRWDALPHEVATRVWELVERPEELKSVGELANKIATGSKADVEALVRGALTDVDFFSSGVGKWLLAAALGRPLGLLTDSQQFADFKAVAKKTAAIVDRSELQEQLGRLRHYVSSKLGIDQLREQVDEATFDKLDAWLKAKLTQFLGDNIDLARLEEVRATIKLLDARAQEFYDKALKALNRRYKFDFAATFQSTTTRTALLDLEFDFAEADVLSHLRAAIDGSFDDLLTTRRRGVYLNMATLSHELARQSSVEVTLPWLHKTTTTVHEALAELDAVDEDDGRLLMYALDAESKVTKVTTRQKAQSYRASSLAAGGRLPVTNNGVTVHGTRELSTSYAYEVAEPSMLRSDLAQEFKPYAEKYFPQFLAPEAGGFESWASHLDRLIDDKENNGPEVFGNTLITLRLALSGKLGGAWFAAPRDETAPAYQRMSKRLQQKMRELMTFYYFSDPANFENRVAARALLVYASSPPCNGVRKLPGGGIEIDTGHAIHWDSESRELRHEIASHQATLARLGGNLERVRNRLLASPMHRGFADDYEPDQIRRILQDARTGLGDALLASLFRIERRTVEEAIKAGIEASRFAQVQTERPSDALESLAKFGIAVTNAFHGSLTHTHYGDAPLRPLGTLLYVEALRALDDTLAGERPKAFLDLQVVRGDVAFPPAGFPDHEPLDEKNELLIHERIVDLG